MHLSAILVTGNRSSSSMTSPDLGHEIHRQGAYEPVSLACVDVLGQSVLERTVTHLRSNKVPNIFVVASSRCTFRPQNRGAKVSMADGMTDRWCSAERILKKQAFRGIDTILLGELGAYAEFDFEDALSFHRSQGQPITPLCNGDGSLGYWFVEADWVRSIGHCKLPFSDATLTSAPLPYFVNKYVNRLANAHDFRRLVVDAFLGVCCIAPRGREIKPGVWVDQDVQLHKTARLVAPAYLGRNTAVHPAAVITRFSNLERRSQVGEGSVVANASILPHTMIGRGLDVSGAMVDGNEWSDLRRNITLQIPDPNLISNAAVPSPAPPIPREEHDEPYQNLMPELEPEPELQYSGYLSRAAGRVLEVFKDEV